MDVDNGPGADLRTVEAVGGIVPFKLNERGEAAFVAYVADGTRGLFVSRLVAVPEPASMIVALAGSVLLLRRLRRRYVA